jgi:hypothetical protein
MTRPIMCLLGASALLGGCVSGYYAGLPQAEPIAAATPRAARPSAYIEIAANDRAGMVAPDELARAVDAASADPGLFSWFTRDPLRGARADYRIAISLSCSYVSPPQPDGSFKQALGAGIRGGTLCVIPCRGGHYECQLDAAVTSRNGKEDKSYQVNDTIESKLYGFYSIPVGLAHNPKAIVENELRTLYRQMLDARAFSAGGG